ncbi:MAG: hypothetical protein CMH54_14700 [Myxococcales bacterium]|nr:hypothetical protein [Myxococcales bacterium]
MRAILTLWTSLMAVALAWVFLATTSLGVQIAARLAVGGILAILVIIVASALFCVGVVWAIDRFGAPVQPGGRPWLRYLLFSIPAVGVPVGAGYLLHQFFAVGAPGSSLWIGSLLGWQLVFCFDLFRRMRPPGPRFKVAWHLLRSQKVEETLRARWVRWAEGFGQMPRHGRMFGVLVISFSGAMLFELLSPLTGNPMASFTEVVPTPWVLRMRVISFQLALLALTLVMMRYGLYLVRKTGYGLVRVSGLLLGFLASVLLPWHMSFQSFDLALNIALLPLGLFLVLTIDSWVMGVVVVALGVAALVVGLLSGMFLVLLGCTIFWLHGLKRSQSKLQLRRWLTLPTYIATVGISVGVWALIVVLSVMRGFGEDLRSKIITIDAHLRIETQMLDEPVPDSESLSSLLEARDDVKGVFSMVVGRAMVSNGLDTSPSVEIKGVDPDEYVRNPLFGRVVSPELIRRLGEKHSVMGLDGATEQAADPDGFTPPATSFPGIILGSALAEGLNAYTGDRIQLISPDGDETPMGIRPRTRTFLVVGTFHSGMYQYDLGMALVAFEDAASFFNLAGGPNRLEVVARDPDRLGGIVESVNQRIPTDRVECNTWKSMNRALLSALELEKKAMFLVLGFIILVASFNIVGSLLLIIMEKARIIAILRAMGGSGRWIASVFLTIGAVIGLIGTLTGMFFGVGTCLYISIFPIPMPRDYYLESLPVQMDPMTIVTIVVMAGMLTVAASLFPTIKAARLIPSEGLRHE